MDIEGAVKKLSHAIKLIKKSVVCSICLEVCTDPCTPRCGHPFCQQCINKVMMKRSAQCPICNGILTRRTLNRNGHLSRIVELFYKIESAIKADVDVEIADYRTSTYNGKSARSNIINTFNLYKLSPIVSTPKVLKAHLITDTSDTHVCTLPTTNMNKRKPSKNDFKSMDLLASEKKNVSDSHKTSEEIKNKNFDSLKCLQNCSKQFREVSCNTTENNCIKPFSKITEHSNLIFPKTFKNSFNLSVVNEYRTEIERNDSLLSVKNKFNKTKQLIELVNLVSFQKLGKLFKKHRQIPFYFLGKLSKPQNFDQERNNLSFPIQCVESNLLVANESELDWRTTRKNLNPNVLKCNEIKQNSNPMDSRTIVLLSPHNDSQLKYLSMDSPEKQTEDFISEIKVNIDQTLEKEMDIHQNEKLRKRQNDSNLNICPAQFKKCNDLFVNNASLEIDTLKRKKEDRKLLQDSDSGSFVSCSLDTSYENQKKLKHLSKYSKQSINFQNSNSKQKVPYCEYFDTNQSDLQSESLVSRLFRDIDGSKDIRSSSVNILTSNTENSIIMQSKVMIISQNRTFKQLDSTLSKEKTIVRESVEELDMRHSSVSESADLNIQNEKENVGTDERNTDTIIEENVTNVNIIFNSTNEQSHGEDIECLPEKKEMEILPNISMNISEEEMMLIEFEQQLFGEKTRRNEDISLLPDKVKQTEAADEICNVDSNMEKNYPLDETLDNAKIFENMLNEDQNSIQKTGIKRKSRPLYHSTPKVSKIESMSQEYATFSNSNTPNTSSMFHDLTTPSKETIIHSYKDSSQENRRLSFICSGLSGSQIECVKKLSKLVNANYVTTFNSTVTHIVVKVTGQQNAAEKTLKYLQGIAYRKWIVNFKWVHDSLQATKLLNEEEYEVVDNLTLEEGPKKSRLRQKNIFEEFICLCHGPFNNVSVDDYSDILTQTGATVVRTLDDFISSEQKIKILILQADYWDNEVIRKWFKNSKAVPIEQEWIVECISQYKLISSFEYLIVVSPEEAAAVGFPEKLLKEEGDSDYEK